jgi:hypothetical protein
MGFSVTWRLVAASAIGTSHIESGADCQDSCIAFIQEAPNKLPMLTLFVADGAGSALKGGQGAESAIQAATEFANKSYCENAELILNEDWALACAQSIRAKIYEEAETNSLKARDYACTFLGVLGTPSQTLLMQVGDGAIVVDFDEKLEVPIKPMVGEYANMTHFITDENAIDTLEVKVFAKLANRVAVFSDGIQRLALNMATNEAHVPFFTSFFNILEKATLEQEDLLHKQLKEFLISPAVNERTDDDKTLVLARWLGNS